MPIAETSGHEAVQAVHPRIDTHMAGKRHGDASKFLEPSAKILIDLSTIEMGELAPR